MSRKLPPEAFEFYLNLGHTRSYQAVADHFDVSKPTVTSCAKREDWQGRLEKIEREVRERSEKKAIDSLEAMNERHIKAARIIQSRALEKLATTGLDTAMEAVKALDLGIKQERLILGEPTDRSAVSVEEIIKREYQSWMKPAGRDGAEDDDA